MFLWYPQKQTWLNQVCRPKFFFHVVNRPSELWRRWGGRKIVSLVQNFFCAFWVPQSPIGLISAEIGVVPCCTLYISADLFSHSLTRPLLGHNFFSITRTKSWSMTLAFTPKLTYDLLCSKLFHLSIRTKWAVVQLCTPKLIFSYNEITWRLGGVCNRRRKIKRKDILASWTKDQLWPKGQIL